jgi:thiamine biosynthesis protein ThiS
MDIELNGEKTAVAEATTVRLLVDRLRLNPAQVAVEVNRRIVARDRWDEHQLQPGDEVEVVHFVGGGGDD